MSISTPRLPLDTSPRAAAIQAELFAEMRPIDRLRAAFDLSVAMRRMTAAGLRNRHGELSEEEVKKRMIEICYGDVLPK